MQELQRLLPNISAENLIETAQFYCRLVSFEVAFESDWFIQLRSNSGQELGIILRDHDLLPPEFQAPPNGLYLTLVVEDVDEISQAAQEYGYTLIQAPEDTFYGQRRLLLKDPAGTLVDFSAPIANFSF